MTTTRREHPEPGPPTAVSDAELLRLFDQEPERAWDLFIDRYADLVFTCLRRLGFDYDESMDRFVHVCEKLCETDFRRLRSVRYLGDDGELTPWLVQVVKNLAVNWTQARRGRPRLLKPIAELDRLDRKIFDAYFRQGLLPSEVCEALRAEGAAGLRLFDVLDGLDRIFERLTPNKLWRLLCQRTRRQVPLSLTGDSEDGPFERSLPAGPGNPEEELLRGEKRCRVRTALAALPVRDRNVLCLRYVDDMSVKDVARFLRSSERETKSALRTAKRRLRRRLGTSPRGRRFRRHGMGSRCAMRQPFRS